MFIIVIDFGMEAGPKQSKKKDQRYLMDTEKVMGRVE